MTSSNRQHERVRTRYGPWAVVTGASSGIGREMAWRLAEAGVNLVLVARRQELLAQIAADLSTQHRIESKVIAADLVLETGWYRRLRCWFTRCRAWFCHIGLVSRFFARRRTGHAARQLSCADGTELALWTAFRQAWAWWHDPHEFDCGVSGDAKCGSLRRHQGVCADTG